MNGRKCSKAGGDFAAGGLMKPGQQIMKLSLENFLLSRHICAIVSPGHFYCWCVRAVLAAMYGPHIGKQHVEWKRPTFFARENADGSERFDLIVIGKEKYPRAFVRRRARKLGSIIIPTKLHWYERSFSPPLGRFDSCIGKRRVAMQFFLSKTVRLIGNLTLSQNWTMFKSSSFPKIK